MNNERLCRWERVWLSSAGVLLLAFGVLTELRGAYQNTRKTDFGVYLRAAYAARSGGDIYAAVDDNKYHYTYPPAFAVVMTPFADAPKGVLRDGLISYPLSVALWTIFNFLLVGRIAHLLAKLVLPDEPRGSRRWWYARTVPFYVASGGTLYSIGFGQVNVVLVWMLAEMLRCSLTGKHYRSGAWLAAATVLKVFPAYLILYPLARCDWKACVGVAAGLAVGLGVIPIAGLGIARTEAAYRSFVTRVLLPGVIGTDDPNSLRELLNMGVNDNQSVMAVIHNTLHSVKATQPETASNETRLVHNAIVGAMTLVTVGVVLRRGLPTNADAMIFHGLLMLVMLHATPMSHMHYFAFGYVLAAGLWLKAMSETESLPGWRVILPLAVWGLGTALPLLPGPFFEMLRFRGLGLASSLVLWTIGIAMLNRGTRSDRAATIPHRRAA